MQAAQSCSMSWSVSSIAASIPSPSRSSLISLSVSTSRLSNWTTTRSVIVARSSGAMSMSGAAVTSIPPLWIERWRGKPSIRAQNSSQRSQSERSLVDPPSGLRRRLRLDARHATSGRRLGPSPPSAAPAGPSGSAGPADPSARGGGSTWPLSGSIWPDPRRAPAARADRVPPRSPSPSRPQPGDARRRVAGTALVVVASRPAGRTAATPAPPPTCPTPTAASPARRTAPGSRRRAGSRRASRTAAAHPGPPASAAGAMAAPSRRAASGYSAGPCRRRGRVPRPPSRASASAGSPSPVRLKNSANPPSASRSRRTMTESYVSSAFATRSTSGRGNPSATPTSRTADRARYVTRLQTIPVCSGP